jgi:putative transposase
MRIISLPKEFIYIAKHRLVTISATADTRMQKLNLWAILKHKGVGDPESSKLLRLSRSTLYRWKKRLRDKGPRGIRRKKPQTPPDTQACMGDELAGMILSLREEYPSWGKDKLVILLLRSGWKTSSSTVGRILVDLKRRGSLHELPRGLVKVKKRPQKRVYAIRKPRDYVVQQPGDLVQVDTLDVRPLDASPMKHFTARDVISRWDVL